MSKFREYFNMSLNESKELFVIFKNNEPFEVVSDKKEAKNKMDDYMKQDKKGLFQIKPLSWVEDKLKKLKPKSYEKLQKLIDQNNRVNKKG